MSTTKGPIERIREAIDKLRGANVGLTWDDVRAIELACDELDKPQPDRIDNGDGTVTFPSVPVTVPATIVADGADVLGVGVPEPGERYVLSDGTDSRICTSEKWLPSELRIILSAPPAPQFREGAYYRDREGYIVGPLLASKQRGECVFTFDRWLYRADGRIYADKEFLRDLLPGEIIVWQPPASMPAEVWTWRGDNSLLRGDEPYVWRRDAINRVWSDWTDPPKPGRYKVPGNGKFATWEGDA